MKFRVKTYFQGEEPSKSNKALAYIFNLFYRSIIPLMIGYSIVEWDNKPLLLTAFLWLCLSFFVLYQFSWEVI